MATNPLYTTKTGPRSNACDSRHSASQISAVIHARHEMATRRRARRSGTPARRSATRAGAALASMSSSESSQTSSRREEDAGRRASPGRGRDRGRNLRSGGGTGRTPRARCRPGGRGLPRRRRRGERPGARSSRATTGRCPPRARRRGAALRRCIRREPPRSPTTRGGACAPSTASRRPTRAPVSATTVERGHPFVAVAFCDDRRGARAAW